MKIRTATVEDRDAVRGVYLSAFPEGEGRIVASLAVDLLSEKTIPETISLVAEVDGAVVGHVAFSPVMIEGNEQFQGYILAPLGVKPENQKHRIGTRLVEHGMRKCSIREVNAVFVYGDPDYYERFGFSAEVARQYTAPYKLQYPFGWQAILLNEFDSEERSVAITCVRSLRDQGLW